MLIRLLHEANITNYTKTSNLAKFKYHGYPRNTIRAYIDKAVGFVERNNEYV